MGAWESKPFPLDDLNPGDLVLFRASGNVSRPYLVRCPSWTGYNYAAFVIGLSKGEITLCGTFPLPGGDDIAVADVRELHQELQQGKYEAIYVRRLVKPLSPMEAQKIAQFARHRVQSIDPALATQAVSVLMSTAAERPPGLNCMVMVGPRNVESFFTSRLIAEMLACLARVQETEPHCFAATKEHERVLRAPVKLRPDINFQGDRVFRGDESFFTPDASPTALPSPQHSVRSLATMPVVAEVEQPTAQCS